MKFYIRIVLLAAFLTSLLSAHAQSPTITWDSTEEPRRFELRSRIYG